MKATLLISIIVEMLVNHGVSIAVTLPATAVPNHFLVTIAVAPASKQVYLL